MTTNSLQGPSVYVNQGKSLEVLQLSPMPHTLQPGKVVHEASAMVGGACNSNLLLKQHLISMMPQSAAVLSALEKA